MIVFNHNLIFDDEYDESIESYNPKLPHIAICEDSTLTLSESFTSTSAPVKLSGQEARYWNAPSVNDSLSGFSWALEIIGVLTLVWDRPTHSIRYKRDQTYTPKRLRFWLYHTFFPIVLELERVYHMLHVGAVEIRGRATLFSAPSYGGKSTLTDYFLQRGHALLSDDAVAIEWRDESYYAIGSYPFHRPYRELESLGQHSANFQSTPMVVDRIFLLEAADADAAVEISSIKGIAKYKALHASSFIDFQSMKVERFAFFSKMSRETTLHKITIPWKKSRLLEVYEKIMDYSKKQ